MLQPRDTSLDEVSIVVAEPNDMTRQNMNSMLRSTGLRKMRSVSDIDAMREAITESTVDILVVSDALGDEAFDAISEVRHNKLGKNPFLIVTVMVEPDNEPGLKKARSSGADDVMIKPIAPAKIVERAKMIAGNRQNFVATTDYIGPERRTAARETSGQIVKVFTTMKVKMDGKPVTDDMIAAAVEATLKAIQSAQLDNQGMRLGTVCDRILKAYAAKDISEALLDDLEALMHCLEQAAEAAKNVGQSDLSDICFQFAREVEDMMDFYDSPTERALKLIQTLTKAFQMARQSAATRKTAPAAGA